MKQLRKLALGVAAATTMAVTPMAANADLIQLGFILDASGSISNSNWTIITQGLGQAINLIPLADPSGNTYEVSVTAFGINSLSYAQASNIVIDTAADRTALSSFISTLTRNGISTGGTNYEAAFTTMKTVLGNTIAKADFSYVNFATDGAPNTCTNSPGGSDPYWSCGVTARDALTAAGVDNISIEGIGITDANATSLQNKICYPTCDTTDPYNFPGQGFYIGVANATQYADAIQHKVKIVTGQVPEPGTIGMVGLALAGLGLMRRRRQAA